MLQQLVTRMVQTKPFDVLYKKSDSGKQATVSVAISCFNYGKEATEALMSLLVQTEPAIDVVVVDDHSPDDSAAVLLRWFDSNKDADKLRNVTFVRHLENHGLSQSRNTALSLVVTPYIFILDADNQLYPRALKTLREALENSGYAMAYSLIEKFGMEKGIVGNSVWIPEMFSYGNYIDAMALLQTEVLLELGGYRKMPCNFGWEDYDLWCSFVDRGLKGCHVPQILCRYRVHKSSMLHSVTNSFVTQELKQVRADFEAHHTMPFYFLSDSLRRGQVVRRALQRSGTEERARIARAVCRRLPVSEKRRDALLAWVLGRIQKI